MQTQINAILIKTTTCVVNDIEQINITESILKTTGESAQKLMSIVNTLSNHRNTSTSTAGVVDEILVVVQELLVLHNDTSRSSYFLPANKSTKSQQSIRCLSYHTC